MTEENGIEMIKKALLVVKAVDNAGPYLTTAEFRLWSTLLCFVVMNGESEMSLETLMGDTGMSRNTVVNAARGLDAKGLITRSRKDPRRRPTFYTVDLDRAAELAR